MPRGGRAVAPCGPIIVGLGVLTEATNSRNATSIAMTSSQRSHGGAYHKGSVDEPRHAAIRKAIAAAVATALALATHEPWNSGLGGIGFALVHRAGQKRADVVDFGPRAPAA